MKVAIVSDTHGRIEPFLNKIEEYTDIELIIHLGDTVDDAKKIRERTQLPMFVVRGNNDYMDVNTPWRELIRIKGHKILLTHGHKENVNFGQTQLYYAARETDAEMVIYGHTHVYLYEEIEGIKILNPGSAGYDRGCEYESFVLMNVTSDNISIERIRL
ncbi:MAG: metallophosphoesterase [Helcococcus sp.]|nr:metallophosphoesterase [Helcococcus sp.]